MNDNKLHNIKPFSDWQASVNYSDWWFIGGLRGSVLTATGLGNGEGQILTPYKMDTPQQIAKNLS